MSQQVASLIINNNKVASLTINNKKKNNKQMSLLSDNYIIIKKLGSGSFGEVYLSQHKDGGYVAAKIEDRTKPKRVLNEYKIYRYLHKCGFVTGLPNIYDFIETPNYNFMFMQLLGPSLEDMFNKYNRKFQLPTVLLLATQLITLLETLHKYKFIHRDIKPNNFLVGREKRDQVYIMDFGLSKKYTTTTKHIKFRNNVSLIGTARYASINMHMGIEPTRRDDMESVGYMLIYFIKGVLPWQGLKKKEGITNINLIGEVKISTSITTLCQGLPNCFAEYIKHCRNLKFDDTPDYDYLRNLFKTDTQPIYEWIE
jgi:casein kinase 1